jgi:hypothetical protein
MCPDNRDSIPRHIIRTVRVFAPVLLAVTCLMLILGPASPRVTAQGARTFKARLSPVPIDIAMQATIAGTGSVTATLSGTKLTVSGTFTGMRSPAVSAHAYRSVAAGVRGPRLFDLTVTRDASGSVSGSATLTSYQIEDLQAGRLYVQIHSEGAPDGNLRGWLWPEQR